MSVLARRTIPAGLPTVPEAMAQVIAERIQGICGPQYGLVTCWRCNKDWDERSDGWRFPAGSLPECADESDCTDRAAGLEGLL